MNLLLSVVVSSIIIAFCVADGLTSWTPGGSLAVADRNQYAAYSEDSYYSDCVWMLGGSDENDLFCYNITTDTMQYWDDLTASCCDIREYSVPASIILSDGIDDYLYFATLETNLFVYHINEKNLTRLNNFLDTNTWSSPCIASNPSNVDEILFVEGSNDVEDNFAVYTISTDSFEFGQDLPYIVNRPSCVMINNQYYSTNPYWYILEGDTEESFIQSLDVSSNDLINEPWATLTTKLSTTDSNCDVSSWPDMERGGAVLFNNLIYVIGGFDTADSSDKSCILTYNLDDNTVSYFGDFQLEISRYGITIAKDRIYIFGGCTGQTSTVVCTDLDTTYVSNDLADPTRSPTLLPSNMPSTNPSKSPSSFPSISPSDIPTLLPSTIPSNLPTSDPSNTPSNYPTSEPSNLPTTEPSVSPSNIPSVEPTIIPSDEPTTPRTLKPSLQPSEIPSNPPTVTPSQTGASSTKKDNDNDTVLGISTDVVVILIIILILGCVICFGLNIWWQRRSQQKIKQYLSNNNKDSINNNDKINTATLEKTDTVQSTDALIAGTGSMHLSMISTSSVGSGIGNSNDYLSALELVSNTTKANNNNNNNNNGNNVAVGGVAAYELPQQPTVNVNQTAGMNMGEDYDENENRGPGSELAEGGAVAVAVGGNPGDFGNINLSDGQGMGTGVIQRDDWTKWDDGDVVEWVIRELKNAGFKNETIAQFIVQFKQLHMTGPLLNIWIKQVNGDAMQLTQKFHAKLAFSKASMVWDVVVQAMLSLK